MLTAEARSLGANNASISKYKLHYPSGNVVTYEAGAAGLTLSAKDTGNNFVTGATYGPDNSLTGFVSGSGRVAHPPASSILTIPWVPLDKSEGLVKQKLSLAMRKHRCVSQRLLTTEDTGKHP